ncbi:MAG: prepilin-type N-terminal cleavage/methylation domain-containing protein [Acidobacteriota bacterium]
MVSRRNSTHEKGFSLIEVMLAMLFLAVSFLALGQLVAVAINQNSMSRSTSVGIAAAMGKLEELRRIYNRQLETGLVTLTSGSETRNGLQLSWVVTNGPGASERIVKVTARPTAGEYMNSRTVDITSHFAP